MWIIKAPFVDGQWEGDRLSVFRREYFVFFLVICFTLGWSNIMMWLNGGVVVFSLLRNVYVWMRITFLFGFYNFVLSCYIVWCAWLRVHLVSTSGHALCWNHPPPKSVAFKRYQTIAIRQCGVLVYVSACITSMFSRCVCLFSLYTYIKLATMNNHMLRKATLPFFSQEIWEHHQATNTGHHVFCIQFLVRILTRPYGKVNWIHNAVCCYCAHHRTRKLTYISIIRTKCYYVRLVLFVFCLWRNIFSKPLRNIAF